MVIGHLTMEEIIWPNIGNNKKREIQEIDEGDENPQELQYDEHQLIKRLIFDLIKRAIETNQLAIQFSKA